MSRRASLLAAALLVVAAVGAGSWVVLHRSDGSGGSYATAPRAARFHCPMHPTMVSDRPGECPICQMRMVPMESGIDARPPSPSPILGRIPPAAGQVPAAGSKRLVYRSTMNPDELSDEPGKDSMGMEMVAEEVEVPAPEGGDVAGLSSVTITARKQQLIGIKTSTVSRSRFLRTIRAVGRVAVDETRLEHVHTKISGYVEKLYANATGELVRKGQPLLEIFSPELLASEQEYLIALRARARTTGSTLPSVASTGEELVASARRRLELFDLPDEQIREIERTGTAPRTVLLRAPISGSITQRSVTDGEKVAPETVLLELADLSRIWVVASVYEYELPFVREGQKAAITLPYLPGRSIDGRVSFIYPLLDPSTRTAQVRIEVANPDLALKPDMFADVALEADLGERLSVPASAVVETGLRSIVYVDRGGGLFEPRELSIGLRLAEAYEVLRGVDEGEKVLTSGNFFVDSESKMKAALASMGRGSTVPTPASGK